MTKAELRRNRINRKRQIGKRTLHGDARKMASTIEDGGTGYYYTTITRFLNEDDSFYSDKVAAAIEAWLDKRDKQPITV